MLARLRLEPLPEFQRVRLTSKFRSILGLDPAGEDHVLSGLEGSATSAFFSGIASLASGLPS